MDQSVDEIEPSVIPHNREAEEMLLGSFLIDPAALHTVDVDPGDFYIHRNQWIYQAMLDVEKGGKPLDYMTLADNLDRAGKLAEAGGRSYLISLIDQVPTSLHAPAYAEIVQETAARRHLLDIANLLARKTYDRTIPVDQIISDIAVRLPALCKVKSGAIHISEYAQRHYERMEAAQRGEEQSRIILTGFKEFDDATCGGLREKELMWLIGLPGLGKTKWALQAAFQMGFLGTGVAVFSWETGEEDIMDREISREARIPQDRLERGDLLDDEWPIYTQIIETLSQSSLPIYVEFCGNMNANALRADLTRLKTEHNIQAFVIDYLKFFNDRLRGESETERQNRISGALKMICRELSLAGIVIDVFNKEGMQAAIPTLDNQTQGADKSYDADKVLFMVNHVPNKDKGEMKQKNVRTFIFGKSRRKLNAKFFHMVAGENFPDFASMAFSGYKPEPNAQAPTPEKQRPTPPRYNPADLELRGDEDEDI
jgi:replicative DNA helicase